MILKDKNQIIMNLYDYKIIHCGKESVSIHVSGIF